MAMNKVPTIVCGIGGIGCLTAQMVSDMLSEEDRKYVGVVGIDTNREDLKPLTIKKVCTSDSRRVKDYIAEHPEYKGWFPLSRFTASRGMATGAGQIRAISRLGMLASVEEGRFDPLNQEIRRILKISGDKDTSSVNIFIVGSITGGTGAGIFLQLPYYIRNYIRQEMGITNIRTRGMFISADVTKEVQPSQINRDAVQVNAYACMKELNAFYLTQGDERYARNLDLEFFEKNDIREAVTEMKEKLTQRQSQDYVDRLLGGNVERATDEEDYRALADESSGNIPYDTFYLIEGTTSQGTTGNASISTLERQISKLIYTLLFTPVKSREEGTADNFILAEMEGNGMNRYSSAGLTAIRYPVENIMEYVTLCWVRDLVQYEWLLLDNKFEAEKIQAEALRKSDPNYKIPTLQKRYPALFDEEVSGSARSRLAFLRDEAYLMDPEEPTEIINKADLFLEQVKNLIGQYFQEERVQTAAASCRPNMEEMKNPRNLEGAAQVIRDCEDAMKKLDREIDSVIEAHVADVANRVFPPQEEIFSLNYSDPLCLYSLIAKVHPVAARFLLYSLLNSLDREIRQLQIDVNSYRRDSYKDIDFYGTEEDGIQSASEAIEYIGDQSIFKSKKAPFLQVRSRFSQAVNAHVSEGLEYGENAVKLNTFTTLKERLTALVGDYEIFFRSIRQHIDDNSDRIATLEKSYETEPYGEVDIYASPKAFQRAYEDYKRTASFVLPPETQEKIFRAVYLQTLVVLEDAGRNLDDYEIQLRDRGIADALEKIFQTEIVNSLGNIVRSSGKGALDLNISQAIEKQFQMETGRRPGGAAGSGYAEELLKYKRALIEKAMRIAAPMVSTAGEKNTAETIYMALNPEAGEKRDGVPDAGATKDLLVPERTEATDMYPVCVLLDEEFSPYEIICVKAKHKLMIENLTKYAEGGDYQKKYAERISLLGRDPLTEEADAYKTVVNPHINRYWHEMAFLPAIGAEAMKKEVERVRIAFIQAFAYDLIERSEDDEFDDQIVWHFTPAEGVRLAIMKNGRIDLQDFAELYDAFRYNGKIVKAIQVKGRIESQRERGYRSNDDMVGWIRDTGYVLGLSGENQFRMNILDILLSMYEGMERSEWNALFEALKDATFGYLNFMFGGVKRYINDSYDLILDRIYSSSGFARVIPDLREADLREYTGENAKYARLAENFRGIYSAKYE